ncbi:hypothetical protein CaCOL14_000428 [Colletotrichum acutatum]
MTLLPQHLQGLCSTYMGHRSLKRSPRMSLRLRILRYISR